MITRSILFALFATFSINLSAKVKFLRHNLETDFKITHPVITTDMMGDSQYSLIVIGEDSEKQRVLAAFQLVEDPDTQKKSYQKITQIVIPKSFLAYDMLKTAQGEKMLFQAKDGIYQLDVAAQNFIKLFESESIYLLPEAQFLAQREFVKDANGDELDDILIPDFKGINLYLQNEQGEFTKQQLPIGPKINMSSGSATYSETPLHFADINLDNKHDLIVIKDSGLQVFHQNGEGIFETDSKLEPVPIDFKEKNWWEIREADGEQMDQNALSYRTVSQLEDVNNDQIVDLMVRFSQTEGVLDRQNNYEVYLGKKNGSKVEFAEKPDSVLAVDGTTVAVKTIDLNGDNKSEILLSSLDIGVSQIIGALLSGSIDQDVYVFKMNGEDKYGEDPEVSKEVELSFSLSSGKSGQPVVKAADFNGDGLKDLMFSGGEKYLKFYMGTNKKRMFKRKSKRLKVKIPKDGNFVDTKDLNNDGKEDVIIRYGRQDDKELSNQILILMSS